jgi:predicted nucleotidyltransferase
MIDLVQRKRPELVQLCHKFGVQNLALFGSAAAGAFDPQQSDLDFLVRFVDRQPTGDYANRFLDFAAALEALFDRPVDLVTEESVRNPFFRRTVESSRQTLYERHDTEAPL